MVDSRRLPAIILPVKEAPPAPIHAPASLAGARLKILLGALLFSTGGTAIKACAYTGLEVAGLRSGIAAVAIFLLLPSARRLGSPRTWLVGLAYAVTMFTFVMANKLTTAANTTFLQSTAPLYICFLGPFLLGERVRRSDLAFMAVLLLGLALFFVGTEAPARTAPQPGLGNLLAALSGVSWALTIIGLRWVGRSEGAGGSAGSAVLAGNLIAFLLAIPWTVSAGGGRIQDWLLLAYLGVFQVALAYVFVTAAIRRLPALEASLLLMAEPVFNPLWAFVIHGEAPRAWALLGGTVIIAATVTRTLGGLRKRGSGR